jgi:hypothetical protein
MFFRAKCPIGVQEKTWVEYRLQWLADRLSVDRMKSAPVVLPNETFFPIEFEQTPACALAYKNIVSKLMSIEPGDCQFEVCEPEQLPASSAHYEPGDFPTIRISSLEMEDPFSLVSTLAQQLSHHILIGGKLLSTDDSDHECVADLLTVFLGFGVFSANSTIRETNWSEGGASGWSMGRRGYLSSQTIGYALALWATARGESNPDWSKPLRPDAGDTMKAGIKFINKTGDIVFHPAELASQKWTTAESIRQLKSSSPSSRLAGLWYLGNGFSAGVSELPADAIEPVLHCLRDREVAVRREAAKLISYAPQMDVVMDEIERCISDSDAQVRGHLAKAIGMQGISQELARTVLLSMLNDSDDGVAVSAAMSFAAAGVSDESVTLPLVKRLKTAVIKGRDASSHRLMQILEHMREDAAEFIESSFSADEDLQSQVMSVYRDYRRRIAQEETLKEEAEKEEAN